MRRSTRRYGTQTSVYSTDPWPFLARMARQEGDPAAIDTILALLDQARDFSIAATTAETKAAKPLLLYYSYLNLAKAYIALRNPTLAGAKAMHGLAEVMSPGGGGLTGASIRAFRRSPAQVNVFDELYRALTGSALGRTTDFAVDRLMPQVVVGHRLWCSAVPTNEERFIGIERITFWENRSRRELWLRLHLFGDEAVRVARSHRRLRQASRLDSFWRSVECSEAISDRKLSCLEMRRPRVYTGRAADELPGLIESLRPSLWAVVRTAQPHRRFYLYLAPSSERASVLPQLLSIYALAFYFGHLTRYKPTEYREMLDGEYGPWIESFMNESQHQFIYLLGSDFCRQDITNVGLPK